MDQCPWCGNDLDIEDIYQFGDLNNEGYYECPHCSGQFEINLVVSYDYTISKGPVILDKDYE